MMYEKSSDRKKKIMRQTGAYSVWKLGSGRYIH